MRSSEERKRKRESKRNEQEKANSLITFRIRCIWEPLYLATFSFCLSISLYLSLSLSVYLATLFISFEMSLFYDSWAAVFMFVKYMVFNFGWLFVIIAAILSSRIGGQFFNAFHLNFLLPEP